MRKPRCTAARNNPAGVRHSSCDVSIAGDVMSRNETIAGWDFAMSGTEFEAADGKHRRGRATPIRPAWRWCRWSTAADWSQTPPLSRPDPSFVTQLIATAEHAPQTCSLAAGDPGRRAGGLSIRDGSQPHHAHRHADAADHLIVSAAAHPAAARHCRAAVPATGLPAMAAQPVRLRDARLSAQGDPAARVRRP